MKKMSKQGMLPPLGWNSWNTFSHKIDENLIKGAADAMAATGLKDAGYQYVVIDDCWSLRERGAKGELVADPAKFPSGMRALADYIHGKGLKFGMYSCAGTHTCAGYPASFEHEFDDAKQFAEWGVDYLKYDYCYKPEGVPGHVLYRRMGTALRNCGRDILFSACNWGADDVWSWIRGSGADIFRSTGDIQDSWESIKKLTEIQFGKEPYNAPYCYSDMDMLVVGMSGKAENSWIAQGGCDDTQYRTHFSIWAIMSSPLMIGCDIRDMSGATRDILTNVDVLAINQDPEGRSAYKISTNQWNGADSFTIVKPLANGDVAVCMVNFAETQASCSFAFWDLGLTTAAKKGLRLYDCWEHKDLGVKAERHTVEIEPHGCRVYRGKVVDL